MHIDWKRIKEKIIVNFKKYFSTNVLFCSYILISIIIGFLLRLFTVGGVQDLKPILCDLTIVILIGSFGYLFKPKKQFIYFFSVLMLYTFLCVANSIYYMFYSSFVSVNLLSTMSMLGDVGDSVTNKLHLINFIYVFAPLLLIIVHKNLCKRKYYFEVEKIEKGKRMFLATAVSGFIIVLLIIFTLTNTEASRFVKQWNREYIVQRFGIYTYTINDVFQSVEPKISTLFGYDESVKLYKDFYSTKENYTSSNKYTNVFKGKNVLFIHAESIQNFLIDLEINDIEITPNLNRIAKEGMYFSSFYPQISVGTSSDTEFTLNTGLMPSSSGTVFVNYFDRTYEAMPSLFTDLGYYTFSMHANNADYWNRKTMHKTLGYQKFYAKDSFEVLEENVIGLGLNDKEFFKQVIEKLKVINAENSKYMGTIITLTNHSPFMENDSFGDIDFSITFNKQTELVDELGKVITEEVTVPYIEDSEIGNYLKSSHYSDEALGEFIQMLEETGLAENTVVIIYGDHEARLGKAQFNLLYNYDVNTGSIKDETDPTYITMDNYQYDLLKNTPLIIWSKNDKVKGEITDVMGMYDVMPTIGNMFGFTPKYALGNDIFSKSEKIVVFPNGNFLTNKVYYNNLKEEYILLTSEPIDADYIDRVKKYADTRLEVSKAIIVHDLIKLDQSIEGEFNEKEN